MGCSPRKDLFDRHARSTAEMISVNQAESKCLEGLVLKRYLMM